MHQHAHSVSTHHIYERKTQNILKDLGMRRRLPRFTPKLRNGMQLTSKRASGCHRLFFLLPSNETYYSLDPSGVV